MTKKRSHLQLKCDRKQFCMNLDGDAIHARFYQNPYFDNEFVAITAEKAIAAALGLAREQDWMPAILCMTVAQQLEGQLISVGTIQRKFSVWGFHLERSLICLCLDKLIDEGFIKILPPDELG